MDSITLFPMILGQDQIAAFILRVVLGVTLGYFAWQKIRAHGESSGSNSRLYGYVELIIAAIMVVGLFTQLAALINVIILVIKIIFKAKESKLLSHGINYYVLLIAMAAALMLIAPGIWSIDRIL